MFERKKREKERKKREKREKKREKREKKETKWTKMAIPGQNGPKGARITMKWTPHLTARTEPGNHEKA